MNPIFTLNYPELVVAEYLQNKFTKKDGHSVLIPLSGQQKGYDLALMRRSRRESKTTTFQVKSSRTYAGTPGLSPRSEVRTFAHYMWLSRFTVPPEADFFVLLGLYAPSPISLKNTAGIWKPHMLLFTQQEMSVFMGSIRQRRLDRPDSSFGFGFDAEDEAFQTRGHAQVSHPDYSSFLLSKRLPLIQKSLI